MFKDDKMLSYLSAIIVMAAMGTILHKADGFRSLFYSSGPEITLVDDTVLIDGTRLQRIDVFANDIAVSDEQRKTLRIVGEPACGRVFVQNDVLQYFADRGCDGPQIIRYSVADLDESVVGTVTATVLGTGRRPALAQRTDTPAQTQARVSAADDAATAPELPAPQVDAAETGAGHALGEVAAATHDTLPAIVDTLTSGTAQPAAAAGPGSLPAIAPGDLDSRVPALDQPVVSIRDLAASEQQVSGTTVALGGDAAEPPRTPAPSADTAPRIVAPEGYPADRSGSAETRLAAVPAPGVPRLPTPTISEAGLPSPGSAAESSDVHAPAERASPVDGGAEPSVLAALSEQPSTDRTISDAAAETSVISVVTQAPLPPVSPGSSGDLPSVVQVAAATPAVGPLPRPANLGGGEPPTGNKFDADGLLTLRTADPRPSNAPEELRAGALADTTGQPGEIARDPQDGATVIAALAPQASDISKIVPFDQALRISPADPEGPPLPADAGPSDAAPAGDLPQIAALPQASGKCLQAPAMTLDIRRAGQTAVSVTAPCHRNTIAELSYSGVRIAMPLNADGKGDALALGFEANSAALLLFSNGEKIDFDLPFRDIDRVSRIALVWDAPVSIELHAQEVGGTTLINPANPRSFEEVRKNGGGFLTTYHSDNGVGQNIQIFSFWHRAASETGVVKLMVDFVSRNRDRLAGTCDDGELAAPRYIVLRSERGQPQRPMLRRLAALQCAEVPAETGENRLIAGAIADLIVAN